MGSMCHGEPNLDELDTCAIQVVPGFTCGLGVGTAPWYNDVSGGHHGESSDLLMMNHGLQWLDMHMSSVVP